MTKKEVLVLGVTYSIICGNDKEFPTLETADGYVNTSTRTIVVNAEKPEAVDAKQDYEGYLKSVVRHEIIHAFLYESGLNVNSNQCESWATNEEMVDWFAIQSPKILEAFKEADVI